jgi:hypothetical protein
VSAHVQERLSEYLDDELVPAERAAIDAHLRECPECARRLEELAAVDDLARALPAEAPEGYFTDFSARVRARVAPKGARPLPRSLPAWLLAAAAALALGVTVPALLRRDALEPRPASAVLREQAPPAASAEVASKLSLDAPLPAAPPPSEQKPELQRRPQATLSPRAKEAPAQQEYAEPHGIDGGVAREAEAGLADASRDEEADGLKKRDEQARLRSLGYLQESPQRAESATFAPAPAAAGAGRAAENDAPSAQPQAAASTREARKDKSIGGVSSGANRFRELLDRPLATAAEARALREAWRVHAALATGSEADEARVRVVEAGAHAYRLARDPADLVLVEKDAEAYLKRADALQAVRVRAALAGARADRP